MTSSVILYFVALLAGTVTFSYLRKDIQRPYSLLGLAFFFTLLEESFNKLRIILDLKIPAAYAYFSPIYFALLIGVYALIFGRNTSGWFARVLVGLILIKGVVLLILYPIREFPMESLTFEVLAVILCSLLGFVHMLRNPDQRVLSKNPEFWLNTANLCYWSFSYMRIGNLPEYLETFKNDLSWFEHLHTWMSIVYYSMLIFILILAAKEPTRTANA